MSLPEAYREVLVGALLAVNSYAYERVHQLMPKLRAARLLDPSFVSKESIGPLTTQLYTAGYDRGLLTWRFAERLQSLMRAIDRGDLVELPRMVAAGEQAAATSLLLEISGVGPVVVRTAWKLLHALTVE